MEKTLQNYQWYQLFNTIFSKSSLQLRPPWKYYAPLLPVRSPPPFPTILQSHRRPCQCLNYLQYNCNHNFFFCDNREHQLSGQQYIYLSRWMDGWSLASLLQFSSPTAMDEFWSFSFGKSTGRAGRHYVFISGLGKCRHFLDFAMPAAKSGIFQENLANSGQIWHNLEFSFCAGNPFKLNSD